MRRIAVFCEDFGHGALLSAIIRRLVSDRVAEVLILNATGGKGRVLREFGKYLKDVSAGRTLRPDAVVAAIDANCKGYNEKRREIDEYLPVDFSKDDLVHAIPDPHIERWMLLDAKAFKEVFGKGCKAPDEKCERDRYKSLLGNAIKEAGKKVALLGGFEYAEELAPHLNIDAMARQDDSFGKFHKEVVALVKRWESQ